MRLNVHLNFSGQCEEAFERYRGILGGKISIMMTYGESPMANQVGAEWQKKIMHVSLETEDQTLMGADVPPDRYQKPQGFDIAVRVSDPAEAERVFKALVEGGVVQMPLQETFWSHRFGMLVDRYGIPWMVNCGKTSS